MAGAKYTEPPRAIDAGVLLPGASLTFYAAGSNDLQHVYGESTLETKLPNPLIADLAGRFQHFWLDEDLDYAAVLEFQGEVVFELDPVGLFPGTDDETPLDDGGAPMPFAVRTFWKSRTTELAQVWADAGMTTPLANPSTADVNGVFPTAYLDDELEHRAKLERGDGVLVYDIDPVQFMATEIGFLTALSAAVVAEQENGATFTAPAAWAFGAGNFSVQAWISRKSANGIGPRVLRARPATGNQSGWELQARMNGSDQQLRMLLRPVSTSFNFDSPPFVMPFDTWYHATVTVDRDNDITTFYLNGAEIGDADISAVTGNVGFSGSGRVILQQLAARVDELRVWSVALSPAQIAANWNVALANPASEPNLIACFKFDEGSGTTTIDSVQGTIATLASGASFVTGPP